MAGSINKVILIGNVGRDPEIRAAQDGSKIANLSIATSDTWKDKITGEKKEKTEWHRVVVFNPQISEFVEKYITKGAKLYLEGQLQTRKWQDQSGAEKYTTEVVITRFKGEISIIDSKNDSSVSSYDSNHSKDLNDDIPF